MRTKDNLQRFHDMKLLYQYLYMSEDHFIDIVNSIGVTLRLHMNDHGFIFCQNMNFPDLPPANWSENMTVPVVFSILNQLETMPAVEFPNRFKNRWDEIKTLCMTNLALNLPKD